MKRFVILLVMVVSLVKAQQRYDKVFLNSLVAKDSGKIVIWNSAVPLINGRYDVGTAALEWLKIHAYTLHASTLRGCDTVGVLTLADPDSLSGVFVRGTSSGYSSDGSGYYFGANVLSYKHYKWGTLYSYGNNGLEIYDTTEHYDYYHVKYSWTAVDTADGYIVFVWENGAYADSCGYAVDVGTALTWEDDGSVFGQTKLWWLSPTSPYTDYYGSDTIVVVGSLSVSGKVVAQDSIKAQVVFGDYGVFNGVNAGNGNYNSWLGSSLIMGSTGYDTITNVGSIIMGGQNNRCDGMYGTIIGTNNWIEAKYNSGYLCYLNGQYLHSLGKGLWVLAGADNTFKRVPILITDAAAIVNEPLFLWRSDPWSSQTIPMGQLISTRVRDTTRTGWAYTRGGTSDANAWTIMGLYHYTGHGDNGSGGLSYTYYRRPFVFNLDGTCSIDFNYDKTDVNGWGDVRINNGRFGVLHGNTFGAGDSANTFYWGTHFHGNTKFDSLVTMAVPLDSNSINIGQVVTAVSNRGTIPAAVSSQPDWPPTTTDTLNDEFVGTTLGNHWTVSYKGYRQISVSNSHLNIYQPIRNSSSDTVTSVLRWAPTGSSWSIAAKIEIFGFETANLEPGIVLSDGTKILQFTFGYRSGYTHSIVYRATAVSSGTNVYLNNTALWGWPKYIKIVYDGTYYWFYSGIDGINYIYLTKIAVASYFTATMVGVGLNTSTTSSDFTMSVDWFRRLQ